LYQKAEGPARVLPRLVHTVFLYEYAAEFVGLSVIAC